MALLKHVLSSMPFYALSFFKAPSGIISSIDSILIFFFGGGGGMTTIKKYLGLTEILFVVVRRLVVRA